jgi:dUTP pyrophosphatase
MNVVLDQGAFLPLRAHAEDAGLDLRSPIDVILKPHSSVLIDSGVHVEIPAGCVGFLKSKSGLMCNHDITSDGTVDCGFVGSIKVKLFNHGDWHYTIRRGDKISQLVVQKCELPEVEVVDKLADTERGSGGLGSTGR